MKEVCRAAASSAFTTAGHFTMLDDPHAFQGNACTTSWSSPALQEHLSDRCRKSLKIILQDERFIHPFNERARDLRVMNKPLWLQPARCARRLIPIARWRSSRGTSCRNRSAPCLVHRDNLYFDAAYIQAFLSEAQRRKTPSRAAFSADDPSFREHALPLSTSYTPFGDDLYLADLWYFPGRHPA